MNTPSMRRRAPLLTGLLAGAALAVLIPAAASAHVHVTPSESEAETTTTLAFSFSHGCEDSPTVAVVIDIPEGVTNVVPVAQGGWSIERETATNGTVSRVTFLAQTPIENGVKGEVAIDARFSEGLADSRVAFPVTQECVEGSTAWTQPSVEGEEEPELPAPVVAVGALAHGTGDHGADTGDHGADTTTAGASAASGAADGTTALWLGGAGLGLGVVALGVAVLALLRRRA